MTTDLIARISNFKQYINDLSQQIQSQDNPSAMATISKFKKTVMKEDSHQHASQFLLDCLRAKHEKLTAELEQLQEDKKLKLLKMNEKRKNNNYMKQVTAGIFITRLTVTLQDIKKVQYDEVNISCDYQTVTINSTAGKKYQNYALAVNCLTIIEEKVTYVHLQAENTDKFNILIKFSEEKQLKRWIIGIKLGIMREEAKIRTKLFEVKKEEEEQKQVTQVPPSLRQSNVMPQIPLLNFQGYKQSPSQTVSMIQEKKDKSVHDKQQKNTERSLVNALTTEKSKKKSFDKEDKSILEQSFGKSSRAVDSNHPQNHTGYKYQQSRPPELKRTRGLSQNIENKKLQILKSYKATHGLRKNSQDVFKTQINDTYHNKMLQKYKMREISDADQSDLSKQESPDSKSSKSKSKEKEKEESSNRQKLLQERKQNFLLTNQSNTPAFSIKTHKISWDGIQEIDDENKSKSSRYSKDQKEPVGNEQGGNTVESKGEKKMSGKNSGHITEKSEEDSPTKLEKKENSFQYAISNDITYDLKVNQVLRKEEIPQPNQLQEENENVEEEDEEENETSSQAHQQNNHQDYTQSQDIADKAQELKKGIALTKCSPNGFWSHQKIVYLSENQTDLCIRDISAKKIKNVKLDSIVNVLYLKYFEGIIKHISNFEEQNCLTIMIKLPDGKEKALEFFSNNPEALKRFSQNLKEILEYKFSKEKKIQQ